jgi:hypothetical protein
MNMYSFVHSQIFIYLHSSRAAVCTPHTDIHCKNLISEALKSAFNQFISKKNSRIAPKIFSELIQRFTDFSVFSFFKDLVLSCGSAKTSFLKAECCRFLGEVLKRHKSLNTESIGELISFFWCICIFTVCK